MSVVKFNSNYRPRANELIIDQRLTSYEYDFSIDGVQTYVFDKELHCTYASGLVIKPQKKVSNGHFNSKLTIQQLFPGDLVEFFSTLLQHSLKKPQMIHVQLNGHHILFSTHTYYDHMNSIIGIIMHEIPFSHVQKLIIVDRDDISLIQVHYIVNKEGMIYAMETVNWNKMLHSYIHKHRDSIADKDEYYERMKGENILHRNLFTMISSTIIKSVYMTLFDHICNNEILPLRFCWYSASSLTERKTLTSLSRFVDNQVFILVTSEVLEEVETHNGVDLITFPHFFPFVMPVSNAATAIPCTMCFFCQRLKNTNLTHEEEDYYERKITFYRNDVIVPLFDPELNVPMIGKRGRQDQQSYKILQEGGTPRIIHAWMTADKLTTWLEKNKMKMTDLQVQQSMCDICEAEWNHVFMRNSITHSPVTHIPDYVKERDAEDKTPSLQVSRDT